MSYYLSKPILKFYYEEIKKAESKKDAIDNFWNNTLRLYFTGDKGYGVERERQMPLEEAVKQGADFIIRYITEDDIPKKVVLVKNQRKGYDTAEAVEQLTNCLKLVRTEQGGNDILYAAVTIGANVRFYYLMPDEQTLRNYPTTHTQDYFELMIDEDEIHKVLTGFVSKTYV